MYIDIYRYIYRYITYWIYRSLADTSGFRRCGWRASSGPHKVLGTGMAPLGFSWLWWVNCRVSSAMKGGKMHGLMESMECSQNAKVFRRDDGFYWITSHFLVSLLQFQWLFWNGTAIFRPCRHRQVRWWWRTPRPNREAVEKGWRMLEVNGMQILISRTSGHQPPTPSVPPVRCFQAAWSPSFGSSLTWEELGIPCGHVAMWTEPPTKWWGANGWFFERAGCIFLCWAKCATLFSARSPSKS